MATPNFPGPNINRLIENDPQIVRVPMEHAEFGARASAQPKELKNQMTVRHVSSKG